MSELKKVTLDGVEYSVPEMTDQQKAILSQISNIEQKLHDLRFQTDQLTVAKEAFVGMLKQSLTQPEGQA